MQKGGYSHAPDDLSYGLDIEDQVVWHPTGAIRFSSYKKEKKISTSFHISQ
jgi:hypothetical protein